MVINLNESYKEGLVSIWWYTDSGEFWDCSKTLDDAVEDHGYLQYSTTENHLTLWRKVVTTHIQNKVEQEQLFNKGYKTLERGRVVFNIRTQCYEVICSKALINDMKFKNTCLDYFNLRGNRVDFEALNHYYKMDLTGNPAIDNHYFDY